MPKKRTLQLTEEQRKELEHHRDHDSRPYVRERSAAMLKIADGASPHWVARNGLLKPHMPNTISIYKWLNIYESEGLQGLIDRRNGGYRRRCL